MCIQDIEEAVINTINPKKGQGALESAVVIILIVAYVYFIASGINIPAEFVSAITLTMGYMFGRNEKKEI